MINDIRTCVLDLIICRWAGPGYEHGARSEHHRRARTATAEAGETRSDQVRMFFVRKKFPCVAYSATVADQENQGRGNCGFLCTEIDLCDSLASEAICADPLGLPLTKSN